METKYDKGIESYLASLTEKLEVLRIAFVTDTLVFPDGEEQGKAEILNLLDDAERPLDALTSYYV